MSNAVELRNEITITDAKKKIIDDEKRTAQENFENLFHNQEDSIKTVLKDYLDTNSLSDNNGTLSSVDMQRSISQLTVSEQSKILAKYNPDDSNYAIGYFVLSSLKDNIGKGKTFDAFKKWADVALQTKNDRYNLPVDESEKIIDVINAFIKDKKFNIDQFDDISSILQKTGTAKMLDSYSQLLDKAIDDYNNSIGKVPLKYKKDTNSYIVLKYKEFEKRFDSILNNLEQFLRYQIENEYCLWYFDMDVQILKSFFDKSKQIKNQTGDTVLVTCQPRINSFLRLLLEYYVVTARRIIEINGNIDTDGQWNLNDVFELVATRVDSQTLKRQILKEYFNVQTSNNDSFPIPLELIEDSLFNPNSNATTGFKQELLDVLKEKYKKNHSHQIENNIRKLILNTDVDLNLRVYALETNIIKFSNIDDDVIDEEMKVKITESYLQTGRHFENNEIPIKIINDVLTSINPAISAGHKKSLIDNLESLYHNLPANENLLSNDIKDIFNKVIKEEQQDTELRLYALQKNILPKDIIMEAVLFLSSNSVDDIPKSREYIDEILSIKDENPDVFYGQLHSIIEVLSSEKIPIDLRRYIFQKILG